MCAPFPERRALLSVATFTNSSSRLKGIASFSSFPGFCSDDAFGFTPFFLNTIMSVLNPTPLLFKMCLRPTWDGGAQTGGWACGGVGFCHFAFL